jgi:hypothetical protein
MAIGSPALADDPSPTPTGSERLKKFVVGLGWNSANFSTTYEQVQGSTGNRTFISLEGNLGLPAGENVAALDLLARVGRKSYISVNMSRFRRSTTLLDLEESHHFDDLVIDVGARVDFLFDVDDYDVSYGHAYFEDDRVRIIGKFGLFIMNIDTGLTVEGDYSIGDISESGSYDGTKSILAPLPLLGLIFDVDIYKRWSLSASVEVFYMPISDITAEALRTRIRGRYAFSKTVGVSFGFDHFQTEVIDKSDADTTEIAYGINGFYGGLSVVF